VNQRKSYELKLFMHANTRMKITQGKYNDKKKKKIAQEKIYGLIFSMEKSN
jgi:hypothetical protein